MPPRTRSSSIRWTVIVFALAGCAVAHAQNPPPPADSGGRRLDGGVIPDSGPGQPGFDAGRSDRARPDVHHAPDAHNGHQDASAPPRDSARPPLRLPPAPPPQPLPPGTGGGPVQPELPFEIDAGATPLR